MPSAVRVAVALAALGLLLSAPAGRAQAPFPTRTVRVVVPYPAGGGTDILGRLLADTLARKWGQSVIVENIGGAAGNIGAAEVFRAAPPGPTLMVTSPRAIATHSLLFNALPHHP